MNSLYPRLVDAVIGDWLQAVAATRATDLQTAIAQAFASAQTSVQSTGVLFTHFCTCLCYTQPASVSYDMRPL